jgi:hypothetical protein
VLDQDAAVNVKAICWNASSVEALAKPAASTTSRVVADFDLALPAEA